MLKSIKKTIVGALLVSMLLGNVATTQAAKQTTTTTATATAKKKAKVIKTAKVTCTASGKLNISLKNLVKYDGTVTATVKDSEGNELTTKIVKKNQYLLTVSVAGMVKGKTYTVKVEGLKDIKTKEAAVIEKSFVAKELKTNLAAKSVTKKTKDTVIVNFKGSAYYKDATVTVKDTEGNELSAKIIGKSKGCIKVKITGLKKGVKYTITVNGVKLKSEKNYSSVTKTFIAK